MIAHPLARLLICGLISLSFAWSTKLSAQSLSISKSMAQRLRESHTGLLDGQSLRDAVRMVAQSDPSPDGVINYWIDRKVNPDRAVSPGALGPTRYASLCSIAEAAGAVCFPVDNCVVIGRAEWVDQLAAKFFLNTAESDNESSATVGRAAQSRSRTPARVDVQWPDLTTPSEALARIRGVRSVERLPEELRRRLPHDLWPETHWQQIRRDVAEDLVLAQFEPAHDVSLRSAPIRCSLPVPAPEQFASSIAQADPEAQVQWLQDAIAVTAKPATQRWVWRRGLEVPADGNQGVGGAPAPAGARNAIKRLREDQRTFTLKVQNKPVGAVLKELAGTVQVPVRFSPAAEPHRGLLVSFSAVDQTLMQLLELASKQASLQLDVTPNGILFSPQ
ncbi:hypothetical protein FYK55_02665 [Roseiconus nitratireducens]|uniref:Uncharacterized protein n=1 Tax=Roseiconus nitratireducens TaxID=2605748 RepID=A0A5M6DLN3_9BACT|nr:hypothetical protein [Roseiconus nitratireducens]KAA5547316.1 hypothetical protein FYK55_02665 [Roseiconus nitratireducens]